MTASILPLYSSRVSDFLHRINRNWLASRKAFATVTAVVGFIALAPAATVDDREQAADRLFSNREPIPELNIQIAQPDLAVLRDSRNSRWETARPEVAVTVREGTNQYSRVAAHLKGARGSFRSVDDKPALTLHFNEFVKGQRFHGLEKISLNNSVQDRTFLSEYIGRRLFTRAGIPVPRVTHATVTLNGRHLGLYVLAEGWNQQFLRRHFADTSGNFYEPPFRADFPEPFEVKSGASPEDHRALEALNAALQVPEETRRWTALKDTLDVDRFVTGMALEILLNHWDGYSRAQNNYRVFHDRTTDRMVFFPHGMDQLFSMRRPDADSPLAPPMRGRVSVAVMSTSEGRQRYFEQMGRLLTNVYHVDQITQDVKKMAARLRPALTSDADALESFDNTLDRLLDQIAERHEVMSNRWKVATTPMVFAGTKPSPLRDWTFSGRPGGRGFFRWSGARYLQINADGPGGGSWRSTVLLNPGRYRFSGSASVMDASERNLTASLKEISLRSSVGDSVQRSGAPNQDVQLRHEFVVQARQYVDLICESDIQMGRTVFDPESLTLSRTDDVR
jgi:hypothetical protein